MNDDLAKNLRLLCGFYKSIADVSRRLEISRPQFNRYLNGRYRPANKTLKKICDFFGVEEHEILLPHDQFERIVQVRPSSKDRMQAISVEQKTIDLLKSKNSDDLDKYTGYYFEYYLSMGTPGKILRALVYVYKNKEGCFYKRVERLQESFVDRVSHCKYLGMAFYLNDRIFMVDYESLTENEITQTILFPTYKSRVTRLNGLRMGASASGERMPCSSRVLLEYLGPQINLRRALKLCRLYDYDADEIDDSVRSAITNEHNKHHWHFRAQP